MTKFLIAATFRDFNKKDKNYFDQIRYVKKILKYNKLNIKFAITQFNEKKVKKILNIIPHDKLFYFKERIPKKYRWSHSKVLINGLKVFNKNDFDYIIWSSTDILINKDIFLFLKNNDMPKIYTFFPNINKEKYNKTFFGMDFFAFKISKKNATLLIKILKKYPNYNWGIFEHFLFSFSDLLNLQIENLFSNGKIFKFDNNKKQDVLDWQKKSWLKNQIIFEKFLKKNRISLLYSKGSMYYLLYRLFNLRKLNRNLILIYLKLIYFFLKRIIKIV